MAQYVIHKIGFFYTDEAFEAVEDARGSIVGIFKSIEEATKVKREADLFSMQNLAGKNLTDFFFYSPDYDEIFEKVNKYFFNELGIVIEDKYYFELPKVISIEQATTLLDMIGVTFHSIVEYEDNVVLDPDDYDLVEQELGEF